MSDDEFKDTVHMWLASQLKIFFAGWAQTLCEPLHNVHRKRYDYVEK
jgi:hypothetical protein